MRLNMLADTSATLFFRNKSRCISGCIAACILSAGSTSPATAAGQKTAAQYTAEADAWEAEADRLLHASATRNVTAAMPAFQKASAPTQGGRVFSGVYGCMNQDGYEAPTMQWGILDGSNYSDFDGHRGTYIYNSGNRVLTFTSGPFRGLRRLRTDPKVFRILDEHGNMTAFNCPWTPKDPRKLHW